MTITFTLKDPKAEKQSLIFMIARNKQERAKVSIGERIPPAYWNFDTCRVKATSAFPGHFEFNTLLDRLEYTAKDKYRRFVNDNKRMPIMIEMRDMMIPDERRKVEPKKDLFGFIEEFIAGAPKRRNLNTDQPIARATINIYNECLRALKEYCAFKKKKIDFASIDMDFYNDFMDFLTYKKKYSVNMIAKKIKSLKTFLNSATDLGINTHMAYKSTRFKVVTEEATAIYLNESELAELYDLDLSNEYKMEVVRDLFIVGCWTGLRFSDYSRIEKRNIANGKITIKTRKTGKTVAIPIHRNVLEIMKKYEGKTANSLPPSFSNGEMNALLKDIALRAKSLKEQDAEKRITKAGVTVVSQKKKWELVTTHTARRSFATNLYLDKIPAFTIMQITGHKTEKGWILSPAYDINPVEDGTGLTLNISEDDNSLDPGLALSVAQYFRIEEKQAGQIIEEIQQVIGTWKEVAKKYGLSSAEQQTMSNAFRV